MSLLIIFIGFNVVPYVHCELANKHIHHLTYQSLFVSITFKMHSFRSFKMYIINHGETDPIPCV